MAKEPKGKLPPFAPKQNSPIDEQPIEEVPQMDSTHQEPALEKEVPGKYRKFTKGTI